MTEAVPDRSIAVEDLLIALDYLEGVHDVILPTEDVLEASGFLRLLFDEADGAKLRQCWPEWFSYYAGRTGRAWRIGGVQ